MHKPYTRDSILGLRLVLDSLVSSYEGSELKKEKKTFAKLFKRKD
jgi:hypothetical protein